MFKHVLLGLSVMIACSACNKKAEGQTVAVVNNEEITASELNTEISKANLPTGADKKQAVARVLQEIVDRRLLAAQAREDGLDRSPEFISRERRMTEDLLIAMLLQRQMETSKLPSAAEIAAFQAKHPQVFEKREIWKLDQLLYDTPTDPTILEKIRQPKTLDQLAEVLTQSGVPFRRSSNQLVTSALPQQMYSLLASLPAGEPFVVPSGGRSAASVITSRQPSPLTGSAAKTEALSRMRRENGAQFLQQRLKDLRSSAKVEYKEGYTAPK